MINIKNFDLNNIKIDEKSYKNILVHYIEYVTTKDPKYVKIYSVNPLYLIPTMAIVRAVFHENKKYYPQVFLDECLHKI